MGHGHDQAPGARCQVHRPAYAQQRPPWCSPVGQIGLLIYLQSPHDRHIHVPAPDHRKGVGTVKVTAAGQCRHRNLAGVNRVLHRPAALRRGTHPQHAVLCVQNNAVRRCDQVRHKSRYAHTQIDNVPRLKFGQRTTRQLHSQTASSFAALGNRRRRTQVGL